MVVQIAHNDLEGFDSHGVNQEQLVEYLALRELA